MKIKLYEIKNKELRQALCDEELLIEYASISNFEWHTLHDLQCHATNNIADFKKFAIKNREELSICDSNH
jgi:hypothetical protein